MPYVNQQLMMIMFKYLIYNKYHLSFTITIQSNRFNLETVTILFDNPVECRITE